MIEILFSSNLHIGMSLCGSTGLGADEAMSDFTGLSYINCLDLSLKLKRKSAVIKPLWNGDVICFQVSEKLSLIGVSPPIII